MHRDRVLKLRETLVWLRATPEEQMPKGCKFDFSDFFKRTECGTVMCLAGWFVERNKGCGLEFSVCGDDVFTYGSIVSSSLPGAGGSCDEMSRYLDIPSEVGELWFCPPATAEILYNTEDLLQRQPWADRAVRQVDLLLGWTGEELKFDEVEELTDLDWPDDVMQLFKQMELCPVHLLHY